MCIFWPIFWSKNDHFFGLWRARNAWSQWQRYQKLQNGPEMVLKRDRRGRFYGRMGKIFIFENFEKNCFFLKKVKIFQKKVIFCTFFAFFWNKKSPLFSKNFDPKKMAKKWPKNGHFWPLFWPKKWPFLKTIKKRCFLPFFWHIFINIKGLLYIYIYIYI